jgi:hypothetical protein
VGNDVCAHLRETMAETVTSLNISRLDDSASSHPQYWKDYDHDFSNINQRPRYVQGGFDCHITTAVGLASIMLNGLSVKVKQ